MKFIIALFIILSLQAFSQIKPNHDIVGLWEHKGSSGTILAWNFKKDGSFVTSIDKKVFTTGKYTFSNDTITFIENGGRFRNISHLVFFAQDSFRIEVLSDSGEGRKKQLMVLSLVA